MFLFWLKLTLHVADISFVLENADPLKDLAKVRKQLSNFDQWEVMAP